MWGYTPYYSLLGCLGFRVLRFRVGNLQGYAGGYTHGGIYWGLVGNEGISYMKEFFRGYRRKP